MGYCRAEVGVLSLPLPLILAPQDFPDFHQASCIEISALPLPWAEAASGVLVRVDKKEKFPVSVQFA